MKKLVFLLVAAAITSCSAPPKDRPPNIVMILADDLGYKDTSIYGSQLYETPNIDKLAARGVLFQNAYSASPLCSPTRASLLTGMYPSRLRFTTANGHLPEEILEPIIPEVGPPANRAIEPESRSRFPKDAVTYAEILKGLGYKTAFLGKWHLGPPPYSPENHGFDLVVGGRQHPGPPPPGGYFAPWQVQGLDEYEAGTHISEALAQESIKFIKSNKDEPFLLNLWYYDVHAPYQAVPELVEKYKEKISNLPSNYPQRSPEMAAMVEMLDRSIGKVIDFLESENLMDDTIIVFTSDNGGNMYDRISGQSPTSNFPLRGGKGINYEGGVKVPLIVSWPKAIPVNKTTELATSSIDIFPTILDFAGYKGKKMTTDGMSLYGYLAGAEAEHRELFFDFPHYVNATGNIPNSSIRAHPWKLYKFYADSNDGSDRFELYNLDLDTGEAKDIAKEHPDVVLSLNALIEQHNKNTDALLPKKNPMYGQIPLDIWRSVNATTSIQESILTLSSHSNDPMLILKQPIVSQSMLSLEFEMKSDSRGRGQIFWTSQQHPGFSEEHSKPFTANHDGEWHKYELLLSHSEKIALIRLDPSTDKGMIQFRNFATQK